MAEAKKTYTLKIDKGFTYIRAFTFNAPATGSTATNPIAGDPVDLTGKSIIFNLRCGGVVLTINSGTPSALGSTITITDAINGKYTLKLTDEETDLFIAPVGRWWMTLIDGGDESPLGYGGITVSTVITG
jgi:hypothetical protein